MVKEQVEAAFDVEIVVEPVKKCWFVKGRDWSEYTSFEGVRAHRAVYKRFIGPLIGGKEICHNCDRKGCVNPDHLFQGKHSDNMQDARNKRRLFGINPRSNKEYKEMKKLHNWMETKHHGYWYSFR